MTSLDTLQARGWKFYEADPYIVENHGHVRFGNPVTGSYAGVMHRDRDTAVRMALAAAIVAEGHDLIGLLREARGSVAVQRGPRDTERLLARVDAVLAAVDGPQ